MPIEWIKGARQLHLHNGSISYAMRVLESGKLAPVMMRASMPRSVSVVKSV